MQIYGALPVHIINSTLENSAVCHKKNKLEVAFTLNKNLGPLNRILKYTFFENRHIYLYFITWIVKRPLIYDVSNVVLKRQCHTYLHIKSIFWSSYDTYWNFLDINNSISKTQSYIVNPISIKGKVFQTSHCFYQTYYETFP